MKKIESFFELNILEYISSFNLCGIYIDVGSNIGNHSLFFANHCPSMRVYSIEPFPETYRILIKNIHKNETKYEIIPMNYAIGCEDGFTYMIEKKPHNSGTNKTTDQETDFKVKLKSLDNLFPTRTDIVVLKIDVEGDELKVIDGSIELIKRCHPLIIIEIHPKKKGDGLEIHINNLNLIMDKLIDYEIKKEFGITYILEFNPNKEKEG